MEDMFCACNSLEEPPTSAVMLETHFSQVVFANVEKFYVPGTDITCFYNISQFFMPHKKDWVGIFRVGWKTTREYITFMWVPELSDSKNRYAEQQQVTFKAYYLPKDDEYYQFCYVDQDGQIHGASVPFQFRTETKDDMLVVTKEGEMEKIQQQNETLLQENKNLKKNLASLQDQNMHLQEELVAAKALQDKVNTLEDKCEELESQKKDLEKEKCAMKEDLMQIKKEKESALYEKEKIGNQLKTIWHQKEECQIQLHIQQKEMENLQEGIKEKAMHLEELKGENYQLNAALFRQQMLNNIQEEQTLALQILKKQKDELELENQVSNHYRTKTNFSSSLDQPTEQSQKNLQLFLNCCVDVPTVKLCYGTGEKQLSCKLWQENEVLKARLPETRSSSAGVVSQSLPNSAILFGNPNSASPAIAQVDPVSLKKCPICQEVFPNDIEEQQYLDHVQNHILDCPYCNKTFDSAEKQVYDDHVFCHNLD
ncbi:PREDICTED: calcium-binding and coiled-coil domain-containing protein 2 isoform X1 [Thamnophis sirtalis]|uniref:Calcium-binding and coiled-coil domain-containing protein 2 n=1 Tax=Thamnophis sirtalis TaxID=35019 RepID=A0A6I9XTW1_9SAUR|nr:PREDICTED: calcium-binding and coiled-coil domain-containing protein 2 isoform X1 [Thamnophis sirtalis]XP_013917487.1 PREDICTED: calcium-binding and coiled-coil domain-containing protein 2 isoform X1 [Thamnophis sirtalis]